MNQPPCSGWFARSASRHTRLQEKRVPHPGSSRTARTSYSEGFLPCRRKRQQEIFPLASFLFRLAGVLLARLGAIGLPEPGKSFEGILGNRLPVSVRQRELVPLFLRETQYGVGVGGHLPGTRCLAVYPVRDAPLTDVPPRAGPTYLEPSLPALGGEGALVVAPGLQESVEYVPEVRVPLVCQTRLPSVRFPALQSISARQNSLMAWRPFGPYSANMTLALYRIFR